MSLWGRGLGVLALLILLLISCIEDTSILGFRKGNKFQVRYLELDVPTSIMLADSLFSYNTPDVPDNKRILVGNYIDDQFGGMKAIAFTQFRPYNTAPTIPINAVFDSLYITLTFDHYVYGSLTPSINYFNIHELTEPLQTTSIYYTSSSSSYNPTPIGTGFYAINPAEFELNKDSAKIDTLRIGLSRAYGENLFKYAKDSSDVFSNFLQFSETFKGFAISPGNSDDRIVGIAPENNLKTKWSRVSLYYSYDDDNGQTQRSKIDFTIYLVDTFNGALGYTNLTANRSSTILAPVNVPYQEFLPPNDLRYVQSGNPIVAKLDFSNYLAFADTVPALALNSAQISIESLEPSDFEPATSMRLRILNSNNRYRKSREEVPATYNKVVTVDEEGFFSLVGDDRTLLQINLQENGGTKSYDGYMTEYLQMLYEIRDNDLRYKYYGLIAFDPSFGKSVNRAIFHKNNIKLKIYYTVPQESKQ